MNEELRSLIESDVQASQYWADRRDAACAERCSAISPKIRRLVTAREVQVFSLTNGTWAAIKLAREHAETPLQVKGACITFIDLVGAGINIDFTLAAVQAAAAILISAGIVTQEQATELDAIGYQSRIFTTDDIQNAMGA
jgi:hypothetical protein